MLLRIAIAVNFQGDPQRARELAEESRALHRGSTIDEAQILYLLGNVAFSEGRADEALELLARSADLAGEVGSQWLRAGALLYYTEYALRLGRAEEAAAPAREVLELARLTANRQHVVYGVVLLAWLASKSGRLEHAGRLWGAVEAEAERTPVGQWEGERDEYASFVVLDDPAFERGRAEGRRLAFDRAVEEALAQPA